MQTLFWCTLWWVLLDLDGIQRVRFCEDVPSLAYHRRVIRKFPGIGFHFAYPSFGRVFLVSMILSSPWPFVSGTFPKFTCFVGRHGCYFFSFLSNNVAAFVSKILCHLKSRLILCHSLLPKENVGTSIQQASITRLPPWKVNYLPTKRVDDSNVRIKLGLICVASVFFFVHYLDFVFLLH